MLAILLTAVGLGVLIAVHEAGHLALARLLGMRVEVFSLGFGPRIAGFRRGETDYRLSAFPLGGYCRIAGFTPDDPAAQDPTDHGSYANKPAWSRFLVIAAGPGVNYLLAFVVIAALYPTYGFPDLTTTRVQVLPQRPAAVAGMRTGDQVVAIDGAPVSTFDDVRQALARREAPAERHVEVQRNGESRDLVVRPQNGVVGIMQDRVVLRVPLSEAVPRAIRDVWTMNLATLRALWDIVRGRGTASLAGPIRIVQEAAAEVKRGLGDFASVLANISVGVAIFNFLPVPALDGGRLVFLGIELVSGRRVNHRTETAVHLVGFLFLLVLFLAVTLFGDLKLGQKLFGWG
ncbi:MAG TPA: RIP metalloprotease [Myxococcales bacterium]|nr:RIP metalloprotease [Myxococcales bacterium]